ncbi:MAG: ComEC/Rec2 family competence protein [Verrucomicrobiae bacterium]|nr:ComEC/Rec2 family competence protein [Verrucomicrobiae bacterium]
MRRCPMLAVGGLLALGVLAGRYFEAPPGILLAAVAATALAALAHARWGPAWLWLMVFLAGWCHVVCWSFPWSPHDLRRVVGDEILEVEMAGRLLEAPLQKPFAGGQGTELYSAAMVEVEWLQRERQAPEPAAGRVMVTVPEMLGDAFFAGQRVRLRGLLQRPPAARLPGGFDYRAHLAHRGIDYVVRTRSAADWQLEGGGAARPPLPARFQVWARTALARGLPEEEGEAVRLLWGMLLGWRGGLTEEMTAPFLQSGTMHLFAISGLHIGLLALVLVAVARAVGLTPLSARLVALPLLWFYIAATGGPASAVRAGIMLSVWWGGGLLRRPPQPLNTVCAAAVLILLWEPRQLFQAGFQLSFAVVLALVLWAPPLARWLESWGQPDPLAPPETAPMILALRAGWRWLAQGLAVSVVAWLASAPLVLWHFHWVTPVCLLANLLMVPLGGLTVAAGAGSLLTVAWWPALGEIFNHSAWALMQALVMCSQGFAQMPLGHWPAAQPPWGWLMLYAALGVGVSLPLLATRWRAGLGGLMAAMVLAWAPLARMQQAESVTVLPLEDGCSLLLRERGWAALVDTGRAEPARRQVIPFLHAQGVSRLDALVITHGDLGQMGGASSLAAEFRPGRIVYGPLWHRSAAYRDWRQHVEAIGLGQVVSAGFQLAGWQLLHPTGEEPLGAADDTVLVWRRARAGGGCLLLSDLSRAGQHQLAQRAGAGQLRADILICGLPEQGEPLADGFLRLVQPRLVIVADSLFPADRRAPRSLGQRLARQRVALWCTRECGAVQITFSPSGWRARAMDGREALAEELPGWQPLIPEEGAE